MAKGSFNFQLSRIVSAQDPVLFSGTLRLNLDPFSRHTDEELWQAIEASHLKELASETENGLQFPIIEGGDNLR